MNDLAGLYQSLLTVQFAILGLIVAGIIALLQLHNTARPRRNLYALIPRWVMVAYVAYAVLLAGVNVLFAWSVSAGAHDIFRNINFGLHAFALSPEASLAVSVCTLVSAVLFLVLLYRSRSLLRTEDYLSVLAGKTKPKELGDFLFAQYSDRPYEPVKAIVYFLTDEGEKEEAGGIGVKDYDQAMKEWEVEAQRWDLRKAGVAKMKDPLAPFIEFCLDCAERGSDQLQSLGLPLITQVIREYIGSTDSAGDIGLLPKYLEDLQEGLVEAVGPGNSRSLIGVANLLHAAAERLFEGGYSDLALSVDRLLKSVAKKAASERVKMHCVKLLDTMAEKLLDSDIDNPDAEASKYIERIEQYSLIAARIAENHFYNGVVLPRVSIIEKNNEGYDDLAAAITNYLSRFDGLFEKVPNGYPFIYLDAVTITAEALLHAMSRSELDGVGYSSHYQNIYSTLIYIPYAFGKDAIGTKNARTLAFAVRALIQQLRLAKEVGDKKAALDVSEYLIPLAFRISSNTEAKQVMRQWYSSDFESDVAQAVNECVERVLLEQRMSGIEHDLFEVIYKPEVDYLKSLLRWH